MLERAISAPVLCRSIYAIDKEDCIDGWRNLYRTLSKYHCQYIERKNFIEETDIEITLRIGRTFVRLCSEPN